MAFHQNTDQVHRITSGKVKISRIRLLAVLLLLAAFPAILLKTGVITLVRGDEYRAKAEQNQLLDTSITAMRGTIYDRNMKVLAQSATVWTVVLEPAYLNTEEKRELVCNGLHDILGLEKDKLNLLGIGKGDLLHMTSQEFDAFMEKGTVPQGRMTVMEMRQALLSKKAGGD